MEVVGSSAIVVNNTGCLEVFSSKYPESAWGLPWIHSLFENAAAVASGVEAGLKVQGKAEGTTVIAQAGDGGTADIGLQALSGMWERFQSVLSICYDNEAYMNTGVQRSGLTPFDANTTTSPPGKQSYGNPRFKKNMVEIAVAHGIPYAASCSVGFPQDLQAKVKVAKDIRGPKYIHIHVPCPLGWRHEPSLTFKIARLAVETGLFPLIEYKDGQLTKQRKLTKKVPVQEYLKLQGRFKHLLGSDEVAKIQAIADGNIKRYGLI
jgi:pyruvate ferredoxin oxidoreductase beta subunit